MQLMLKLHIDETPDIGWHAYSTSEMVYSSQDLADIPVLVSVGTEMAPLVAEPTSTVRRNQTL